MNATTTTTEPVRVRNILTTDAERLAYMDENYPNRPTCCFCKKKVECPYGNNPAPLAKRGKCCGMCNQVVIFVRMGIIPIAVARTNKKNLKALYDLVVQPVAPPVPVSSCVPPLPTLDEDMTEEEYEANHSIARAFEKRYEERNEEGECPDLRICFDNAEMEQVVSADKAIVLRQQLDCYCYGERCGFLPEPEITTIPVPYNGRPITKRDCCEALVSSNWKCCNHLFLEMFHKGKTDNERIICCGN